MTSYNVHLYREMRLTFPGIIADSPQEAAKLVRSFPTADATEIEDCDGSDSGALVDLVGDDEFEKSVMIEFEPDQSARPVTELLDAVRELLTAADDLEAAIDGSACEFADECRALRKTSRTATTLVARLLPSDSPATPPRLEGNPGRAKRADSAIAGYGDDLRESNLIDLLADIMHWCDANRSDFHYMLAMASRHYINELNGQQLDERRLP